MPLITLEYKELIKEKIVNKKLQFSKHLLKEPYKLESLFVSKVQGKSMEPLINDNSLVIADLSQNKFLDNGIFLVYYENKMWIKKSKTIDDKKYFVSINKNFSHLIYKNEDVRIIAKVLLTFTNL